jgi:hypothetical protein
MTLEPCGHTCVCADCAAIACGDSTDAGCCCPLCNAACTRAREGSAAAAASKLTDAVSAVSALQVRKRHCLSTFGSINDHFTKTGSGQT